MEVTSATVLGMVPTSLGLILPPMVLTRWKAACAGVHFMSCRPSNHWAASVRLGEQSAMYSKTSPHRKRHLQASSIVFYYRNTKPDLSSLIFYYRNAKPNLSSLVLSEN